MMRQRIVNNWSRLLAALVALCLLVHIEVAAAATWLRADTHNFIIFSSGSDAQLRDYAARVERFDGLLRRIFKVAPDPHPYRLTIYLLSGQDKVASAYGDSGGSVAGFYHPDPNGSFAVGHHEQSDSRYDLSGSSVLLHEYAHHFMFHNSAFAYPTWYVEGFAEYVSSAGFEADGSWTLGRPLQYRAYSLLNYAKALSLRDMLTKPGVEKGDLFYGKSWLLVHMLRNRPERSKQFDSYLRALSQGKSANEAAAAFGDLDNLDHELQRYMFGGMRYVRSTDPLLYDPSITVAALDAVHGRLLELDLARRNNRDLPKVRDSLARLAEDNPGLAEAWLALAQVNFQLAEGAASDDRATGDAAKSTKPGGKARESPEKTQARAAARAAAQIAVDKALALNPGLARANVLKADLLADRLAMNKDHSPAAWREVRGLIIRANRADTEDPVPLVRWFETYARMGSAPDQAARDGLTKAFLLEPEVPEVRTELAFDMAARGKFEEAIALVEFLARDPHQGRTGTAVLAQLQKLRDAAATGKTASAPPQAAAQPPAPHARAGC